jgi:hypothetical protein
MAASSLPCRTFHRPKHMHTSNWSNNAAVYAAHANRALCVGRGPVCYKCDEQIDDFPYHVSDATQWEIRDCETCGPSVRHVHQQLLRSGKEVMTGGSGTRQERGRRRGILVLKPRHRWSRHPLLRPDESICTTSITGDIPCRFFPLFFFSFLFQLYSSSPSVDFATKQTCVDTAVSQVRQLSVLRV